MADLKNLTSDAKRLYEALEYLLDRQSQENEDEIDFKEICFSAKSRPFVNHTINRLDESEVNNYLLILAGLIAICDDSDKKKMQIRVLARIMAGYYKNEIPLQDIINRGKMLREDNIDELQQIYNKESLMFLLIDLLIMVYLDDSISEKQLDYAIGMIACIGIDREKTKVIAYIVKGILEQKDELILAQVKNIDVSGVYCYMQNIPDGVLVYDLEQAKKVVAEKIIFHSITFEAVPTINMDEFKAEIIEFSNCCFNSIQGLVCKNKKLLLKDCEFKNSSFDENFFILKNGEIKGCSFDGLNAVDCNNMHMFCFYNTSVEDTDFHDISVQHNSRISCGGVLNSKNCFFRNVAFENIVTVADDVRWCSYRRVFSFDGGRMIKCKFKNGSLCQDSFLLTFTDDTVKSDIEVENFEHKQNNVNYNYKNYDLSIEDIFGDEN